MDQERTGPENATGTASATDKERTFGQRVDEFHRRVREQLQDMDQNVRDTLKNIVPPDVSNHLKNSKREFLLAIRAVIDSELKRSEPDHDERKQ